MGRFVGKLVPDTDPDRLQRILNAKQRLIGIDKQALDSQVAEKADRKAEQKRQDQACAELAQQYDQAVSLHHQEVHAVKQAHAREVSAYRQTHQGKETTREWDLNRPDALRHGSPARVDDTDARCGPSSLQRFEGEDLSVGNRTAAQMAQCASWWDQQSAEKAASKAAEAASLAATAQLVRSQDALQMDVRAAEASHRTALNRKTAEENRAIAAQRVAAVAAAREEEAAQKSRELDNTLSSPWLNEDPREAVSHLSPARVRKDHFKGMADAQKRAIQQQQLEQVAAKQAAKRAALEQEAEYARTQAAILSQMDEQAKRAEAFRRAQAQAAAAVLKAQMEEKKQRTAATDELYANRVQPGYFAQFGTSHR